MKGVANEHKYDQHNSTYTPVQTENDKIPLTEPYQHLRETLAEARSLRSRHCHLYMYTYANDIEDKASETSIRRGEGRVGKNSAF